MKIKVTQEDIDKGSHLGPSCPIALAIKRRTGRDDVYVDNLGWGFLGESDAHWALTMEMTIFVYEFDNGYLVKPREFVL